MKFFKPRRTTDVINYAAKGESCFILHEGVYYLRKPIELKFYNGMTWENFGEKWTIRSPPTDGLLSTRGSPVLIE